MRQLLSLDVHAYSHSCQKMHEAISVGPRYILGAKVYQDVIMHPHQLCVHKPAFTYDSDRSGDIFRVPCSPRRPAVPPMSKKSSLHP